MESQIPAQPRMDEGIMGIIRIIGGIDGLHTKVETHHEVVEVQAQAEAVARSDVIQQAREPELSLGLVFVVADGPDVSCIEEQGPVELPEQMGTVLDRKSVV